MEVIGYIGRIISHYRQNSLGPYILQVILLLVAPSLFAATIYMIFSRLIIALKSEEYSLIPVRIITKTFVGGDVFSFLLQSGGAGFMANDDNQVLMTVGKYMVVAGLIVQLLFFGVFVAIEIYFYLKIYKSDLQKINQEVVGRFPFRYNWKYLMHSLLGASVLILIRSIYRVVEYVEGTDGYVFHKEIFMYIFDTLLMFHAVFFIIYQSPGSYLIELRKYTSSTPLESINETRDESDIEMHSRERDLI